MIRYGKVKFIQIDAGIAGGIIAGKEICDFAEKNTCNMSIIHLLPFTTFIIFTALC